MESTVVGQVKKDSLLAESGTGERSSQEAHSIGRDQRRPQTMTLICTRGLHGPVELPGCTVPSFGAYNVSEAKGYYLAITRCVNCYRLKKKKKN